MRLIDADELNFGKYKGIPIIGDILIGLNDVAKELKAAPTIDAVPVVHGRWKIKLLDDYQKYNVTCSICGWVGIENYDSYDVPSDFNYCPNCGAKMDLEG